MRTDAMRTDTELQRGVMEALAWEPSIDSAGIGVSAESGIVMLTGTVKSLPQKWTAVRVAQRVAGVKAVTDAIIVKLPGDSERSDADIARAAVNALDWNVSVPRNRVKVVVEHGRITLEGELRFHYEKVAAERAVRHLIGVTGVSNLISVKPPNVSAGDVKQQDRAGAGARGGTRCRKDFRRGCRRQGNPPRHRQFLDRARRSGVGRMGRAGRFSSGERYSHHAVEWGPAKLVRFLRASRKARRRSHGAPERNRDAALQQL